EGARLRRALEHDLVVVLGPGQAARRPRAATQCGGQQSDRLGRGTPPARAGGNRHRKNVAGAVHAFRRERNRQVGAVGAGGNQLAALRQLSAAAASNHPLERDMNVSAATSEAPGKLPLTFACGLYDRMLRLYTGEVQPRGIDLRFLANDEPRDIFDRMGGKLE